jgi:hypothetical protein
MSTTKRILLGMATLWPMLYIFVFMAFVMGMMFIAPDSTSSGPPVAFMVIFPLHMLTILGIFALIAAYLVMAIKNKGLEDNMRIIWVILFVTFGVFAMPVYWWLHVWNAPIAIDE